MLRPDFVECIPDPLMIVEISTAGERDARAGWQKHLCLGELFDVQEISAVDHRRRQGAVIDLRSRARTPGGTGLGRVELCEMVAEEFEGVASFSECEPLRDQPLKFDRADFRANLFRLRTPLRGFAVVELAVNASLVAMK